LTDRDATGWDRASQWMSVIGTSRHFAAAEQFGRFQTEADISRVYEYTA